MQFQELPLKTATGKTSKEIATALVIIMPFSYAVDCRERYILYQKWFYYKTLKLQHCNSVGNFIMTLGATVCFKRSYWLECHHYHYLLLKMQFTNTSLLGDSIITGLPRYSEVWQRYFTPLKSLIF